MAKVQIPNKCGYTVKDSCLKTSLVVPEQFFGYFQNLFGEAVWNFLVVCNILGEFFFGKFFWEAFFERNSLFKLWYLNMEAINLYVKILVFVKILSQ